MSLMDKFNKLAEEGADNALLWDVYEPGMFHDALASGREFSWQPYRKDGPYSHSPNWP